MGPQLTFFLFKPHGGRASGKEKEESCGFRSQLFWQGRTNGGGPALPSINQLRTFTNDFRSRSFRLFAESIAD
jgi:hypothetical protein